jgi:hypothetical protein
LNPLERGTYARRSVKPPGSYKIRHQRRGCAARRARPGCAPGDPSAIAAEALWLADERSARLERLRESLRGDLGESGTEASLRIRQIFREPKEIYRLEITLPSMGYQRTTFLDRELLEELLEDDVLRGAVSRSLDSERDPAGLR